MSFDDAMQAILLTKGMHEEEGLPAEMVVMSPRTFTSLKYQYQNTMRGQGLIKPKSMRQTIFGLRIRLCEDMDDWCFQIC